MRPLRSIVGRWRWHWSALLTVAFLAVVALTLAIRGGRHVFLLEVQGSGTPINPFGCALSGLLAGLFTDKAYGVISDLVDNLIKRIRAATAQ